MTYSKNAESFTQECRTLSFLNCLNHSNIIELLASYTHNGVHNLLFPLAEYDLNSLLRSSDTSLFASQTEILFALSGLASALDSVHAYSSETLDISLIGCHHDLRPHNILIRDKSFLLADFGLATLKNVAEGSRTIRKIADTLYLAPECEDFDRDFQPNIIGRKSDIWSFGCILMEIVTYIMRGSDGVKSLEHSLKVVLNSRLTVHSFHAGRRPNKSVQTWLTELQREANTTCAGLIALVHETLRIEPNDRPNADQITRQLRLLTLKSLFTEVEGILDRPTDNLATIIERERLTAWAQVMGIKDQATRTDRIKDPLTSDDLFRQTYHGLATIQQDIRAQMAQQYDVYTESTKLRMAIDKLLHAVPVGPQITINSLVEQRLVNSDDLGILQQLRLTFDEKTQYRSVGILAAVRYMHQLCEAPTSGHGRRLQLKIVSREMKESSDHFDVEDINAEGWARPTRLLVERVEYAEHWVDSLGDELFDRIGAILELLRVASRADKEMRLLAPRGWFHEPQNCSFKLVFQIPETAGTNNVQSEVTRIETLRQ